MDGGDLGGSVATAVRALNAVSEMSAIDSVPSIRRGNDEGHAIGLGQMNLHGFLARERIHYGSPRGSTSPTSTSARCSTTRCGPRTRSPASGGSAFAGFERVQLCRRQLLRQIRGSRLAARDRDRARALRADGRRDARARADWARAAGRGDAGRALQPQPPGGTADGLDQLHQQRDLLDPPDRRQDRDPQGGQDRPRLLPGALHDERQSRVLPRRLRDRARSDHRHLRGGDASTWIRACR